MATNKQKAEAVQADPVPSAAEARTELGRALRIFQAFQAADRVLAVLENAEQVTAERNKAASEATQRLEAVRGEVAAAQESRDQARREASDIRADAKAKAADVLDAAKAEAQQITSAASARLAELIAEVDAKDEARKALVKDLAALDKQLVEARATIQRAETMRAALAGV